MTPHARALGYVRVSTEEQARHGISIEAQTERIRAYCLLQNLQPLDIITDEGVSAAKELSSRPGGQKLTSVKAGHIVALKLDRLFRSAIDALQQTQAWDKRGIALHLIDMGGAAMDTRSAMGRMFLTLMAAFAEWERNIIAERTSTALQHKKAHRQVYGPTPFGFARHGDRLEESSGELEVVARIQAARAAGKTFRAIADELNESKVPLKRGGSRWFASTVQRIAANKIHAT